MRIKKCWLSLTLSMLCIRLGVLLLAISQTRKSSQLNRTAQTLQGPVPRQSVTSIFIEHIEYDIMAQ